MFLHWPLSSMRAFPCLTAASHLLKHPKKPHSAKAKNGPPSVASRVYLRVQTKRGATKNSTAVT